MIKFFRHIRKSLIIKNKTGKYFKYAIGEIALVMIGILLALQINNWNEDKKTAKIIEKTLERIEIEIKTNQKQINDVYQYHIMVSDTLNKISMPTTEEEAGETLKFWKGLQIPRLQEAAFQTAIQNGIGKDINIELLESLNALYTSQTTYNEFSKTASLGLYNMDFSNLKNFKQIVTFLNMIMVDLYYFETDLKQRFNDCLKEI
ncbi:hypothetical protein [Pontimicrobium sp. SW4]|uniref:Uncharacterized protein n=1 Tax=Pontimicrobium sp. SW4 TaxID=3153519 RepID=A0AAU7BUD0_9FLAO